MTHEIETKPMSADMLKRMSEQDTQEQTLKLQVGQRSVHQPSFECSDNSWAQYFHTHETPQAALIIVQNERLYDLDLVTREVFAQRGMCVAVYVTPTISPFGRANLMRSLVAVSQSYGWVLAQEVCVSNQNEASFLWEFSHSDDDPHPRLESVGNPPTLGLEKWWLNQRQLANGVIATNDSMPPSFDFWSSQRSFAYDLVCF